MACASAKRGPSVLAPAVPTTTTDDPAFGQPPTSVDPLNYRVQRWVDRAIPSPRIDNDAESVAGLIADTHLRRATGGIGLIVSV